MAKYFIDENGNYYETTTDIEIPAGQQVVTQRPSVDWIRSGNSWVYVEPTPEPIDLQRNLNKREFEMLLALSGLEDVWGTLEEYLKTNDVATYATIRGERNRSTFELPIVLSFVSQMRPALEVILPGTDVSDVAIETAWETLVASVDGV